MSTQIISEGIATTVKADGTQTTGERDTAKEKARVDWLRSLWMGTTKVDVFATFGSPDLDAEVEACWGPFSMGASKGAKKPAYAKPWNGQDVPEQYRLYLSPRMVTVASQGKAGATSEVSRWGLAVLDFLARTYPDHVAYVLPVGYTLSAKSSSDRKEHHYPAGTVLGSLAPKDIARLLWAVRGTLPRHLSGDDRNKDRACVHALMGRTYAGSNGTGGGFTPL